MKENNKKYSYFDLHCDTLTKLIEKKELLRSNKTAQVSLDRASEYLRYSQVFAVFCPPGMDSSESWKLLTAILEEYSAELVSDEHFSAYLSVENALMLDGDLAKIYKLAELGVCFITPVWKGINSLGGAHDTKEGLSSLGAEAISVMLDAGIIPDVSHASEQTFEMIARICEERGKAFVATHSDSKTICGHSRNLSDSQFRRISECGGLVGISLYPDHLSVNGRCSIDVVVEHIGHYLSIGGEDAVCFGCDFDGIDKTPDEICDCADVVRIAGVMKNRGYSDKTVRKVFYENAEAFFDRNGVKPITSPINSVNNIYSKNKDNKY